MHPIVPPGTAVGVVSARARPFRPLQAPAPTPATCATVLTAARLAYRVIVPFGPVAKHASGPLGASPPSRSSHDERHSRPDVWIYVELQHRSLEELRTDSTRPLQACADRSAVGRDRAAGRLVDRRKDGDAPVIEPGRAALGRSRLGGNTPLPVTNRRAPRRCSAGHRSPVDPRAARQRAQRPVPEGREASPGRWSEA